jgi:glycerol-3-phosphate acyltransferase PlsY
MIINGFLTIIVAVVIGYLFGSIPTAYILTKLTTGKDIRKLGGGNVGTLNTFLQVGHRTAILVALIDICKGIAVVVLTHWALNLNEKYTLIAVAAAVIGHSWMIWLKFSGGKGIAVIAGTLLIVMPVYGYTKELFIIIGLVLGIFLPTRNVALAMGIALMVLPFLFWLGGTHSGLLVIWYIVVAVIVFTKFSPQAIRGLKKTKNIKQFIKGR